MKLTKKIAIAATTLALAGTMVGAVAGCNGGGDDGKLKIAVLTSSETTSGEAKAFYDYYTSYITSQYENVTITYSSKLDDDAATKTAAENFIGQNYDAIIDMADHDRAGIATLCNTNKVYYAIASGTMGDADWEACKSLKYFVGQVGPSTIDEYNAGLAMGQYFKNTYFTANSISSPKVALYGAFIPNPMHVYRLAGIVTGLGDTYKGKSGMAMVGDLSDSNGAISESDFAGDTTVCYYMSGNSAFNIPGSVGTVDALAATSPDVVLGVGMTTTFFGNSFKTSNLKYTDIDAFTADHGTAMNDGNLVYLAGKYASSIGPVFSLIKNAVDGNAVRDNGNAVSISHGYVVAKSYTEYQAIQSKDSGSSYVYGKTVLDKMIGTGKTPANIQAIVSNPED